ncbi:hypothetical protein [Pinibacter soli]|uniref:Lipoprotein n=1 Tax=Pinibacter soli TaxID=3044211 RepID=A0ABT6RDE5_9BACT|nr:hypothetical protein [Pinibacter soli]MDI3320602.1 hypothetical protein [Pinibacter soli]
MKRKLVIAVLLFASCNYQSKSNQADAAFTSLSNRSLVTLEQEIDNCHASITKYEVLIDKTLAGDVEAMKKLTATKESIVIELDGLKKKYANLNATQTEKLAVVEKRFRVVDGRIK